MYSLAISTLVFIKDSPAIYLGVHRSLGSDKRYEKSVKADIDEIWDKSMLANLLENSLYEMKAEHLLIYLCLHFSVQHSDSDINRLIWIRDIKEVLQRHARSFDWGYFTDCARKWQTSTHIYFPLFLAQELTDITVPKEVMEKIRPRYLSARILERMLNNGAFLSKSSIIRRCIRYLNLIVSDRSKHRLWAVITLPLGETRQFVKRRRVWLGVKQIIANRIKRSREKSAVEQPLERYV